MKKIIVLDELNGLTESQKKSLQMLWRPKKYDMIVVLVCTDVENDTYDYDLYVIQEILVKPINEDRKYTVSRNPVHAYDYYEMFFKGIPLKRSERKYEFEDVDFEEAIDVNVIEENTVLINRKDSLPLLDITKMIEILYEKQCKAEMILELIPDKKLCRVGVDGNYFESGCLCDSLWEALKKAL